MRRWRVKTGTTEIFYGWRVVAAVFVLAMFGWGLSFHGPPEDVRFIARGVHLAALRDKGLTLNSATGAQKVRGRPV
jgi:hypothetical protein